MDDHWVPLRCHKDDSQESVVLYHQIVPADIGSILDRAFGFKNALFTDKALLSGEVQEKAHLFENIFREVAHAIYALHSNQPLGTPIIGPWTDVTLMLIRGLRSNCSDYSCLKGLSHVRQILKKCYESDDAALQQRSQIRQAITGVFIAANPKSKKLSSSNTPVTAIMEESSTQAAAATEQDISQLAYSSSPIEAQSSLQEVPQAAQSSTSESLANLKATRITPVIIAACLQIVLELNQSESTKDSRLD